MQKVQLAILLDATASMQSWIDACKNEIKRIMVDSRPENAVYEVALVAYTDFENDVRPEYVVVNFTESMDTIRNTLKTIEASGGGDIAEDVAGALNNLVGLRWDPAAIKHVIHLADAPPHGRRYHEPWLSDSYPNGDPYGLDLEKLLDRLRDLGVTYTFFHINESTDTFISVLDASFTSNLIVADLENQEYTRMGVRTRVRDLDDRSFSQIVSRIVESTLNPASPGDEPADPVT